MNENINLCEILKGHEGETFYSPAFGKLKLIEIYIEDENSIITSFAKFKTSGKIHKDGECMLFPSKDQRDWNKWAEEQPKIPKTWQDLINKHIAKQYIANTHVFDYDRLTPIEKSALALLKIHQLIEEGYGGNVTNEEWKDYSRFKEVIECVDGNIQANSLGTNKKYPIALHTVKQAKEFLSYPENVQLIKDFYMI